MALVRTQPSDYCSIMLEKHFLPKVGAPLISVIKNYVDLENRLDKEKNI